jgi:hypothetical protein
VAGGVAWPTIGHPAYYCIFGQDPNRNHKGKKPLKFIAEAENHSPEELYGKLILDSRKLLCWDYYADLQEKNLNFYQDFISFMSMRDLDRINLQPASVIDYTAGLLTIQNWIRSEALKGVPKDSILGSQLREIKESNYQEPKFYAVDALRCVISSFNVPTAYARPVTVKPSNYIY